MENQGNVAIEAEFTYTYNDIAYEGITYSFTNDSLDIEAGASGETALSFAGKLDETVSQTTLGAATVKIAEKAETVTEGTQT